MNKTTKTNSAASQAPETPEAPGALPATTITACSGTVSRILLVDGGWRPGSPNVETGSLTRRAAKTSSGQSFCQSQGNISSRVTWPPVASSIGAPKWNGIAREPSAHRLISGACAQMAFANNAWRPRACERYSCRVMLGILAYG